MTERKEVTLQLAEGVRLSVERAEGSILYVRVVLPDHSSAAHVAGYTSEFTLCRHDGRDALMNWRTHFPLPPGGFDTLREALPELAVEDYRGAAA